MEQAFIYSIYEYSMVMLFIQEGRDRFRKVKLLFFFLTQ